MVDVGSEETDDKEESMNNIGLSRQRWAEILIPVNAASMVLQYVMQGVLVSGDGTDALSSLFWTAEWSFWGVRALVESMVILYLFKTKAEKTRDKVVLTFFEVSLIALIMLTLGPTLRALATNQSIDEMLTAPQLTAWTFGLAAYGGLMLAGVGVAFRIQPSDVETLTVGEHDQELAEKEEKHTLELSTVQANLSAKTEQMQGLESELEYLRMWKRFVTGGDWFTTNGMATIAGFVTDSDAESFAKAVNSTAPEVRDALARGAELRDLARNEK